MRLYLTFFIVCIFGWTEGVHATEKVSLAGSWRYQLDRADVGESEQWYRHIFTNTLVLPGSLPEQGIGDEIAVNTPWTATVTPTWYNDPRYAPYRNPGNIKISFFLQPNKFYVNPAWYQREINIPEAWNGLEVLLSMERVHWGTSVWVDGTPFGSFDSLGTPHLYNLGKLPAGSHLLSIRVDNRLIVDVGGNASSVTDHTQGNWNGIVGEISLSAANPVRFDDVQVYPHVSTKSVTVKGSLTNSSGLSGSGEISIRIARRSQTGGAVSVTNTISWDSTNQTFSINVPLTSDAAVWDEFTPVLFDLSASLMAGPTISDTREFSFGLREITTQGTQFILNGHKAFIRGTLETCVFPNSGHPPTDVGSWRRIIGIAKSYGLNLFRFHSWCPPEAAFEAADELGFYYQVECESWTTIGDGAPIDQWLYTEATRILKSYGNHPSFLLMTSGNEPFGSNHPAYLSQWVSHFKARDSRHLFTGASGWPEIAENQFLVAYGPRIQWWGAEFNSYINAQPPQTTADFGYFIAPRTVPVISHEIGQWCVYPNFDEIPKYTNYLKPKDFEIFRDFLGEHQMSNLARPFLLASGKLQELCYKEEIESALRTPGMGGFELLDLHDFPGQGPAPVGVVDAFWDDKGYVTAPEYSRFCNSTVPLIRLAKRVFTDAETLDANAEVAHFGAAPLTNVVPAWSLIADDGSSVASGTLPAQNIAIGNGLGLGSLHINLAGVPTPARYRLELGLAGTRFTNDWDVWVYPAQLPAEPGDQPIVTEWLTPSIISQLQSGAKVLVTVPLSQSTDSTAQRVKLGFSSIFWNTAWTGGQKPTTLGILCDPANPLFKYFPTDSHSNWQWWYFLHGAEAMVLEDLPAELNPAVRVIDDWFTARRLGMLFEAKMGLGKLVVCSINVKDDLNANLVARQFRHSLLNYMASSDFDPKIELSPASLQQFSQGTDAQAPTIVEIPQRAVRLANHVAVVRAVVTGTPPFSYAWFQNGRKYISGSSLSSNISMTLLSAAASDAGSYLLQVTNSFGSVRSQPFTLSIINSAPGGYSDAVADLGPIAYWRFDELGAGTDRTSDLAGDHPLTHTDVTFSPGPVPPNLLGFGFADANEAATYSHSDSISQAAGLSLSHLGNFTLSGWFSPKTMPQPSRTALFGQNDFAELGFHNPSGADIGAPLGIWVAGPAATLAGYGTLVLCTNTDTLILPGKWYFVAATADGTNESLYVNGALIGSAPAQIYDHYSSNFPFQAGAGTLDPSGDNFNGSLDELAVFDRALSANEISSLYQKAVQGVGPILSIRQGNGKAVLDWVSGVLQTSTQITGTFTNVPRAFPPYTYSITNQERYFRLKIN